MFEEYSERARRVVLLARLIAGQKGAPAIDVEHLIEGLVREDQGEIASVLGVAPEQLAVSAGQRLHRRFFSSEAASQILMKLERPMTVEAIPPSADMPVSPQVGEVFREAMEICIDLRQSTVEPLHLLAAVLSEESSGVYVTLQESGVTREAVIVAIRNG